MPRANTVEKKKRLVPETRGRSLKYDVSEMKVKDSLRFARTKTATVLNSAKQYAERKGLNWEFQCYTENGHVVIVRVK